MSAIEATKTKIKSPGESILFGFDFTKLLASGETLSSVTHVQEVDAALAAVSPQELTYGSPAVNVATFENDEGSTVAVGAGIQVRISAGTLTGGPDDDGLYHVRCRVATSASNTRDIIGKLQIE